MRAAVSIAPNNPSAMTLGHVCKYFLRARGDRGEAIQLAAQAGALPRIQNILKSIPYGTTGDADFGSVLSDNRIASDAFIESLSGASILATMVTDGALRRVPLNTRLGQIVTGSSGGIVDEGQTVRGSRLTLEGNTIPIIKGQSFIAVSNEVAAAETLAATALVNTELKKAVIAVVDAKFSEIALAGAPSNPASGATEDDFWSDVNALLTQVNIAGARLYWVMGASVANRATLYDKHGTMSPAGGVFVGVPAIVSSTVDTGTLQLFDANSIAGDFEGVSLATSKVADLDLGDPPDSPTTSATVKVSLWQNGMTAIKATSYFGAKKLRTNAAAEITGIANSPDSPA